MGAIFVLVYTLLTPLLAVSGEIRGEEVRGFEPLENFFKLTQELPSRVCDESVVSRAPSLGFFHPPNPSADRTGVRRQFSVALLSNETELIRALLDDPAAFLGPKELLRDDAPDKRKGLKRGLALELCQSLLRTEGVQKLLREHPEIFFRLNARNSKKDALQKDASKKDARKITLEIQDIDERFGRLGKSESDWWGAGWIEGFEVIHASIASRMYARIAQPVTNMLRGVVVSAQVNGKTSVPIGLLSTQTEWKPVEASGRFVEELWSEALAPDAFRARIDAYRAMLESMAFKKLTESPGKGDEIKKLHEFYRSIFDGYALMPEDQRFKMYRAQTALSLADVKRALDKDFLEALNEARLGGSRVGFTFWKPDPSLEGILAEARTRFSKL